MRCSDIEFGVRTTGVPIHRHNINKVETAIGDRVIRSRCQSASWMDPHIVSVTRCRTGAPDGVFSGALAQEVAICGVLLNLGTI